MRVAKRPPGSFLVMGLAREEARHDGMRPVRPARCLSLARWAVAHSTPSYLPTSPDLVDVLDVAAAPHSFIMELTGLSRPSLKLVCCRPQALNGDGGAIVDTQVACGCYDVAA